MTRLFSLKKYRLQFAPCSQIVSKIPTKTIDKNETLKGNYISWQYKYSGMNKVSQTSRFRKSITENSESLATV